MRRVSVSLLLVLLFAFALHIAQADPAVPVPRLRIVLEPQEQRVGISGWLQAVAEFLQLRAGRMSAVPGTKYRVTAVAYSSTVSQTDLTPCITAAGTRVRQGIIATNFLPLGTKVRIGDNIYVVEDRMNEKYDGKFIIDVWHPTTREAREFGVQQFSIEILNKETPTSPKPTPEPPPAPEPSPIPTVTPSPQPASEVLGLLRFFRSSIGAARERLGQLLSARVAIREETDCLTEE